MMTLTLIPQLGTPDQPEMTIHVSGDVLTIDGAAHDMAPVSDGDLGIPSPDMPLVGHVERIGGVIHATVIARLGATAADDPGGPWVIANATGDVAIPALRRPVSE